MATIKRALSAKTNPSGRAEIMLRVNTAFYANIDIHLKKSTIHFDSELMPLFWAPQKRLNKVNITKLSRFL